MRKKFRKVWEPDGEIRVATMDDFTKHVRAFAAPRANPSPETNRLLFRGTANVKYELVPSLPRVLGDKGRERLTEALLYEIEAWATALFARKAQLYVEPQYLPSGDDPLRWWQLMQHYGACTRLLDWSDSPYVALYFAVVAEPAAPGMVWMVDNGAFGDRMGEALGEERESLFRANPNRPQLAGSKALVEAKARYDDDVKRFADALLFFPCTQPNARMSAQHGWFSCGSLLNVDHGVAIARTFAKFATRRWCLRLRIEAAAKQQLLRDLHQMNISAETIYGGLDGLGRAMGEMVDLLHPDGRHQWQMRHGQFAVRTTEPPVPTAATPPHEAPTAPGLFS